MMIFLIIYLTSALAFAILSADTEWDLSLEQLVLSFVPLVNTFGLLLLVFNNIMVKGKEDE